MRQRVRRPRPERRRHMARRIDERPLRRGDELRRNADGPLPPGSRGDLTAKFLRGTIDARSYADRSTTIATAASACCCGTAPTHLHVESQLAPARARTRRARAVEHASRRDALAEGHCRHARSAQHRSRRLFVRRPDEAARRRAYSERRLLPQRGNDLAFERRVAPIFIRGEEYGTRACSAVTIGTTHIHFAEQTFGPTALLWSESRRRCLSVERMTRTTFDLSAEVQNMLVYVGARVRAG